jgi:hypothetical protein
LNLKELNLQVAQYFIVFPQWLINPRLVNILTISHLQQGELGQWFISLILFTTEIVCAKTKAKSFSW